MKKLFYVLAVVFAVGVTQVNAGTVAEPVACEKCTAKSDQEKKKDGKTEAKACCAKKAESKSCAAKTEAEKQKCHSKAEASEEKKAL